MFGTPHVTNNEFSVWFVKSGGQWSFLSLVELGKFWTSLTSIPCTSYLVVYLALKLEELKPTSKCMYGISQVEFTKVNKIHVFLVDLLKRFCVWRPKKTKLSNKLIGLRFNMENWWVQHWKHKMPSLQLNVTCKGWHMIFSY